MITTLRAPASPVRRARLSVVRLTLLGATALAVLAWGSLLRGGGGGLGAVPDAGARVLALAGALVGLETELSPTGGREAWRSAARWVALARLAGETVSMSVLAIAIAAAGAVATVMPGARRRSGGASSPELRAVREGIRSFVRAGWVILRAVPELVWALLVVLVMPPGVLAGAVALGLHNMGILGKLCSEIVEDLDPGPERALRAAGATLGQVLAWAVLPQVVPQFLTFALYRWEVVIRSTIVVGFVSAGGLGREFRLAMSFFHFADVGMILLTYFLLVVGVDLLAGWLRRLARNDGDD